MTINLTETSPLSIPEALILLAPTLHVLQINSIFRESFLDINGFIGSHLVDDFIASCDRDNVKESLKLKYAEVNAHLLTPVAHRLPKLIPIRMHIARQQDESVLVSIRHRDSYSEIISKEWSAPSQEEYDNLIDYLNEAPIGLQWLSSTGHVLWSNRTQQELLEYSAEELLGKHITDFSTDDSAILKANFQMLQEGGILKGHCSDWKTKSGAIRHVVLNSNVHRNTDGSWKHSRCFISDNTIKQIQEIRVAAEKENQISNITSQDHFIRKVLHEIKTPLNIILQLVSGGTENEIENHIAGQVRRVMRLLKDTEDAHQFQQQGQTIRLKESRVHLPSLLKNVLVGVASQYPASKTRNISLQYNMTDKQYKRIPAFIKIDSESLTRVLAHLFDNACRYGTSDNIDVYFSRIAENRIRIQISNPGPQLDQAHLQSWYYQYWHGIEGSKKEPESLFGNGGVGLGLHICFQVLSCLDSELKYTYDEDEKYVVFTFDLECTITSTEPNMVSFDPDDIHTGEHLHQSFLDTIVCETQWMNIDECENARDTIIDDDDEEEDERSSRMCSYVNICEEQQEPKRINVLIVEDNIIGQKLLCRTLSSLGCVAEVADNGQIGYEMAISKSYDLVLMDLRMPVCDGLQSTILIRKECINLPIVALTADTTPMIQEKCKEVGMSGYVMKPVSRDNMKNLIDKYANVSF